MSRIIDEYGNINPVITERFGSIADNVDFLCNDLNSIASVLELNGREIRQLYQYVIDIITAEGMEETMRYGIRKRKGERTEP